MASVRKWRKAFRDTKPKPKRVEFHVSFNLPEGCGVRHAEDVLLGQIMAMGGDLRPPGGYDENDEGDPMFGFDIADNKLRIKRVRKPSC